MSTIPLLIFAKSPIPGKVKTRLMTHCTAEQAASIARIILNASIELATAAWPGEVILSTWPSTDDPIMQNTAARFDIPLVQQAPGDLGAKMAYDIEKHGYPAAVLGSDAAMVKSDHLLSAHNLLQQGDNVIGPSEDGGYYLIGLTQPQNALFEDMPWGAANVLQLTLDRQSIDNPLSLLPVSYDIDTWQDVQRAREKLPELDNYLTEHMASN